MIYLYNFVLTAVVINCVDSIIYVPVGFICTWCILCLIVSMSRSAVWPTEQSLYTEQSFRCSCWQHGSETTPSKEAVHTVFSLHELQRDISKYSR